MNCQVEKNKHFRHLLLFGFNQGLNASKAAANIREVYGEKSIADSTARKWFSRFNERNFDLSDAPCSDRPTDFNEEKLNALIHENPRQTTRELAETMQISHMTISRHLHSMGKVQKLGSWVPHQLDDRNKNQRITISASLLARHRQALNEHQSFLKRIITGDEKWCMYVNMKQRKGWVSPNKQATPRVKPELHPQKTMLSVWWDWEGVIHFELLPRNETITAQLYTEQLRRLSNAVDEKRPHRRHNVILQHDNARPHIANVVKLAIEEFNWEVLPHPAYSPDLAPSDFHLFRSLSNAMRGITFNNNDELQNWLVEFFEAQPRQFYRNGIEKLVQRWEEVIQNAGEYIND